MRWHKNLTIAALTALAVAVVTAGAFGHPAAKKNGGVKGKIHKGTLTVTGSKGDDTLTLALRAGDPNTLVVSTGAGDLTFDRSQFDTIVVNAGKGDDTVSVDEQNGAFTDTEATTLNGEDGDDTLLGGSFAEQLNGGDGNDLVDGNRGADTGLLGAGDDTFRWDPGDGSDVVEGQDGNDTMLFNGANVAERFELSANGSRLRFTRDIGNITMDTDGVEVVDVRALGGADTVIVNDLSGTAVARVEADLGAGDGHANRVVVNGTNADDVIAVAGSTGSATVGGLAATVSITGTEPAVDTLVVEALGGDDVVEASALAADAILLSADGGANDDVLIGGAGDDVLSGGDGDDVLIGGPGLDTLDGGSGNNVVLQ